MEECLLSHYPSNIQIIAPLIGYHATEHEVQALNSLLAKTNGSSVKYVEVKYTTNDRLVSLEDFLVLYKDLKRYFSSHKSDNGGWLKVNDFVIPYVDRSGAKLVPIDIVRFGGHILTDVNCTDYEVEALAEEVGYLNRILKAGGFSYFLQPSHSKLISIILVWSLCEEKPRIRELPEGDDPMVHASIEETEVIEVQSSVDLDRPIFEDIEVLPILPTGDSPMIHASFDEADIIDIQSSASSADSDVEIISEDSEVTPIIIVPNGNSGEEEMIYGGEGNEKIENSECGVMQTVALQTPQTVSHIQPLETKISNPEVDFVDNLRIEKTLPCGNVPDEASVNGCGPLVSPVRHACNGLVNSVGPLSHVSNGRRDSAGPLVNACSELGDSAIYSIKGKSARRRSHATVEKERQKKTITMMSSGNPIMKRRLNAKTEPIKKNIGAAPYLSVNANIASAHSLVNTFNHGPNAKMSQFNLRPYEANTPVGGAMHPSNESFYSYNIQPNSSFPAQLQDSTYIQRNRFQSTGFTPASNNYQSFATPYTTPTTPHYFQNTTVSDPPNYDGSRSIETVFAQRTATRSDAVSSLCYGYTVAKGCNGLGSVQPSAIVTPHGSEMFPFEYNYTSTNGTVCSYPGKTILCRGNNLTPDNSNGSVPPNDNEIFPSHNKNTSPNGTVCSYPGKAILSHGNSHGNNLIPANSNGSIPPHGNHIFSSHHNTTSLNGTVCSYPSKAILSHGNNPTPDNSHGSNRDAVISYPPKQVKIPKPSDVYLAQQDNLPSCIDDRNGITSESIYLTGTESYPPVKAFQPPAGHFYSGAMVNWLPCPNNIQWDRQQSSSITHSSLRNALQHSPLPSSCFPTGSPLRMPPHTLQPAVQNKSDASAGKGQIYSPSSQPSGEKFESSQATHDVPGYKPWKVVKQLSNSECIVITTLYGTYRALSLLKNNTLYVLLESLRSFFYNSCSLESFLYLLEVKCAANTIALTKEEETGFVECLQIPNDRLLCNRAIAIDELTKVQNALLWCLKRAFDCS